MVEARKQKTQFDPNFFIPEGVESEDVEYIDDEYIGDEEVFDAGFSDDSEIIDPADDDGGLETPDGISVVSMTSRMTRSGQIVVDVVLEIDEIDDLSKYEVRITK